MENYETLSEFDVVTAEWAQTHLMDQVIVKVDTSAGLTNLPNEVKTAYVKNTGVLMARNVANAWVPMGGVAHVSGTAPSNPQVGQMWINPNEVMPLPIRQMVVTTAVNVTSGSWTNIGTTASMYTDKAVMCVVSMNGYPEAGTNTALRGRMYWSGATVGDSYSQMGGWGGVIASMGLPRVQATMVTCLVIGPGTTTFGVSFRREYGTATSNVADVGITVTPVAWADQYASGVS